MGKDGARNTAAENLRHARIGDVCTWVKNSWKKLPNEMIVESFKTCKISNNLNESNSDLEVIDLCDTDNKSNSDLEIIDLCDTDNNNDKIRRNEHSEFIHYQDSAEMESSAAINNLGYVFQNGIEVDNADESNDIDSDGYVSDD